MTFAVSSLWRPTSLILLGLFLRCEAHRVNTEIQAGPLYRVVGSQLSISCSASGFADEKLKKDFEFRMVDPARPTVEINVISSADPDFSYSRFWSRAQTKAISITHVDPNSIIFEIKHLLKVDEGEYECTVINPEYILNGVYTAKTVVKVIDDSLSVTSSDSTTSLSFDEGESLTLTCQASTNTIQHVHLSLIWYLRKDGAQDAIPIISLDRDFTLTPGQGFEQRYKEEAISLDKLGEAEYRLKIAELALSDQGQIYCQAQEWIQDPDRSWYMIAQKNAEEITLTVKAKVVTDTSALGVNISAPLELQEGQELLLPCSINAQNLARRFFSLAWLWEGVELARIGPTGILTVKQEYSDREKDGELRATRTGNGKYLLRLKPVRTTHGGNYICRAWPEERGEDGNFKQGAAQDSQPQNVKISPTESELTVEMQTPVQTLLQGDRLRLVCKVEGVNGGLSIAWQRKSAQSLVYTSIISLSESGVTEKAEAFASHEVRVTRTSTKSFVFELDRVAPSDAGTYGCVVSETQNNGKTLSQSANVIVNSIDSLVKVSLKSRTPVVTLGTDVELMCKVLNHRIPVTLTWSLKTDDSNLNTILVLYSNGSISWSGDQHRYQVTVNNRADTVMHYLKILAASHREAGVYQCEVSVFLDNVHKKLPPSNPLKVMVQNPACKLALSSKPTITESINTDIQIDCKVTLRTSESSIYAVTWELQQEDGSRKTILSSDRNALITFGPQIKESHRQRIGMRRTDGPTFELTIRQARISDKGIYVCKVEEFLQDPQGEWFSLSYENSTTDLNVMELDTNLSIEKNEVEMNVSIAGDFSIPCHITQQSSNESQFQVTWFWQKDTEAKPIFTAYRNSTLQARIENVAVRYGHPLPGHFNLIVLQSNAENSGLYFCEVEEWLYSFAYGWRKVAVERSGNLNVNVDAEGIARAVSDPAQMANIWMAVFVVTMFISFFIIMVLVVKICKGKTSGGKKSANSLWMEPHRPESQMLSSESLKLEG
ncbi:hypothetical protein ATANTOWER_010750 [Ataeniobius toweri]|uniref:Ig-like domain-containing protein n=1 Tax=Ataeniobius toweri TaxID=208326 RepID=A0ABU7AIX9_9TELE|nr:hypothetical protein [Ataeniobius toweri]